MKEVLIVDGYNVIGAWGELQQLKELNLALARDRLIELLADYQAYSGKYVYVVFDAYKVPGLGAKEKQSKVDVRYTKEKETADEMIERLVAGLGRRRCRIQVATSDSVEQSVTFGLGGLRISARELRLEVQEAQQEIQKTIRQQKTTSRNRFDSKMSDEMKDLFERWRRGDH